MDIKLCLCVLLTLTGCASNDPWTRQDTIGQTIATLAIICDGLSSFKIRETDGISEHGAVAYRIIGRQPKKEDLILYHTSLAVSSWLIARALPAAWRPYWQTVETGAHGYACYNNCQLELC